jgi:outer membrane protein assembly factor BamB
MLLARRCLACLFAAAFATSALAADWPTYRHDLGRTAIAEESLPAAQLARAWAVRSPFPPSPAWDGPARWDAYHRAARLAPMRDYDLACHPVVVGTSLYYGSSSDDAVHCVDTRTGKEQWVYTCGGPIHVAPHVVGGKLYFGADDGFAYCLDAATGRLIWKFSPSESNRLLFNNGRLISFWPVRTGVVVDGGTAYFAASLFPWRESYLCAVDAETGKPEGEGRWVQKIDKRHAMTLEGSPAANKTHLFIPQGRTWLAPFDRKTGGRATGVKVAGGGCFVLVTPDGHVAGGSASRGPHVQIANLKGGVATHNGARSMVVTKDAAYMISYDSLFATDWPGRKQKWLVKTGDCFAHLVAGDTVFLGVQDAVRAYNARNGTLVWEAPVEGDAHGLAVADGALFVSTHEGQLVCFRPKDAATSKAEAPAKKPNQKLKQVQLAAGPFVRFTAPDTAEITWETAEKTPSIVEYGEAGGKPAFRAMEKTSTTEHTVEIGGLRHRREHGYRIVVQTKDGEAASPWYTFDAFFNEKVRTIADRPNPFEADGRTKPYAAAAQHILDQSGVDRGICIVYAGGNGRLGYEIAARSLLRVICVSDDLKQVQAARDALQKAGAYGARVAVLHVPALSQTRVPNWSANLITVDTLGGDPTPGIAREVYRMLRPCGGVGLIGQPTGAPKKLARADLIKWLGDMPKGVEMTIEARNGLWATLTRKQLTFAGEWSHQYGTPANQAFGGETLAGATGTDEMVAQWAGRPGPRHHADRQVRKSAPLAINGRLFIQGLDRIIAVDSYNGERLWTLEIPDLRRFNIPRDAANYCADKDNLYLVSGDRCWTIAAETGKITKTFKALPVEDKPNWKLMWGYVASIGDKLIGSTTHANARFKDFWGGQFWFDSRGGWDTAKVCSDKLFALDKSTGIKAWERNKGVIPHTTLCSDGTRMYFLECRNPKVKKGDARKLFTGELWKEMYLVALDLRTGKQLYDQKLQVWPGHVMTSLSVADGKLALCNSHGNRFHAYVFDAKTGKKLWDKALGWRANHHGGHLSRPAIVGKNLYIRPYTLDLDTGKLKKEIAWGGCGTYACSTEGIIFRAGHVTFFNPKSGKQTNWQRLRPDCWLSTIPAQGMVLSPEGGGGCWCSSWMETSIGFAPLLYPQPTFAKTMTVFAGSTKCAIDYRKSQGVCRYTLDGNDPTKDSPKYEDPITIEKTCTVKARFFHEDGNHSPVSSLSFEAVKPVASGGLQFAPGVKYLYYEGNWPKLPDFRTVGPKAQGTVGTINISPAKRNDQYGFQFLGHVRVLKGGRYTFFTISDDGSKLWIGDRLVVNNDNIHPPVEKSGTIELKAGMHPITVSFAECGGGEHLQVLWQGPGFAKQEIPNAALFHAIGAE